MRFAAFFKLISSRLSRSCCHLAFSGVAVSLLITPSVFSSPKRLSTQSEIVLGSFSEAIADNISWQMVMNLPMTDMPAPSKDGSGETPPQSSTSSEKIAQRASLLRPKLTVF